MLLDSITVGAFARISDYVGAWAIDPQAGSVVLSTAKALALNLAAHVAESDPPKPKAEVQYVTAGINQKIAIIQLSGTLMKASSSMMSGTSTVAARREIRKAAGDPEVSAILLAIDSPGGTVAGTADLGSDIAAANQRKPVYAFCADLCASAAYWLASQAEQIFANDRTALVGSIGTMLVVQDDSAAAEKEGIKTFLFKTGPIKGAGTSGTPVTEEHQAYYAKIVDEAQKSFDAAIQRGRQMTDAKLSAVKTGGVFNADEAVSLGLIDGIKSMEATLTELAAEARRRNRSDISNRAEARLSGSSAVPKSKDTDLEFTDGLADVVKVASPAVETLTKSVTTPDPVAIDNDRIAANFERIAGIRRVAAAHEDIIAKAIKENWSVEKSELAAMKASLPKVRPMTQGVPNQINRSHEKDCTLDALAAATILRCGGRLDSRAFASGRGQIPDWLRADINDSYRNQVMDHGHKLSDLSAVDLCREALRIQGRDIPLSRTDMIRAAVSGGTLTSIFTTNVNAILLMTYFETGDTTMTWTREAEVADFKTNERIRMKTKSGMSKLPRGGTADHAKRDDTAESYKIARYADQFTVDEQDIIDDSLNALSTMPVDMARAAARLRPDLVYAILLANPTMADAVALFSSAATRGNLGSTSALNATNLKAGISAMRLLQENGVNIGLAATHLVVPATLDWTARELVNSTMIVIAGTAGSVTERGNTNTLQNAVTVVSDERLENGVIDPNTATTYSGSASTWFLASTQANTIEVGFLRGKGKAPTVRSFIQDKGAYGIGWDVELDIGAKATDWRGLRKTTA